MAEYKNHRQAWSDDEEIILIDTVIGQVEKGNTQRDAFRLVSDAIGRTEGAIEYRWKQIRKEHPDIMDRFQDAVADGLISAMNNPQNPQGYPQDEIEDQVIKEITKGATKIHKMIEQIINPGSGITLPPGVAEDITDIESTFSAIKCYDVEWMKEMEYDHILEYINGSPENARNYFRGLEQGFDVGLTIEQKIRTIYDTLNLIKPNEPGYMMARGMIVMMWHTIEILGIDAESVIGIEREMPF